MGILAVIGAFVFSIGVILLVVVAWRHLFGPYCEIDEFIDAVLWSAIVTVIGMVLMFWGILGRLFQTGFFGPITQ